MILTKHKTSFRALRFIHRCRLSTTASNNCEKKQQRFARCNDRVFSGIQPTGVAHLGNYVGAISQWVRLQHQYDSMMLSVVDLHSITITQEPSVLRENILYMTACLLACGIKPERTILFQQSTVPYHAELAWILGCLCTLPRLANLPQWKDKSKKVRDPGVGLFTYPILQTADILLYKSTTIPVGEDQTTHLELARDLARAFNRTYDVIFPKPKPLIGEATKIRSLKDPTCKMSKSDPVSLSRIDLTDNRDLVIEKVKKAVTDSVSPHITYDPVNRPGIANLIDIHSALTGLTVDDIVTQSNDLNTIQYKAKIADVINTTIQPISEEITKLVDEKQYLLSVLRLGAEKATEIAEETMKEVRSVVGLR